MRHKKNELTFWSREAMFGEEQEISTLTVTPLRATRCPLCPAPASLPPLPLLILPLASSQSKRLNEFSQESKTGLTRLLLPFPRSSRGADHVVCPISCQLTSENKNNRKQSSCGCCWSNSIYVIQNRKDLYSQR